MDLNKLHQILREAKTKKMNDYVFNVTNQGIINIGDNNINNNQIELIQEFNTLYQNTTNELDKSIILEIIKNIQNKDNKKNKSIIEKLSKKTIELIEKLSLSLVIDYLKKIVSF